MANTRLRARWDTARLVTDMASRGWNTSALARAAGLSYKTTDRFLTGQVQTPKTAAKLAAALGYSVRRYFSRVEAVA